ncbi:MAG: hypothetical protein M3040_11920, partial [Bacteroidota bacterium]|nr:hypothetical protein [Bacteroidota bacterium]
MYFHAMNQSAEKVLSYLAGNADIDAVPVEDLKKLVAENAYFPVAQFLLTWKLKKENSSAYLVAAPKTSLYFSNPYWLQYQLTEESLKEDLFEIPGELQHKGDQAEPVATVLETATSAHSTEENEGAFNNKIAEPLYGITVNDAKKADQSEQHEKEGDQPRIIGYEEESNSLKTESENTMPTVFPPDSNTFPASSTVTLSLEEVPAAAEMEVVALEEEMAGAARNVDVATNHFIEEAEHQSERDGETMQDEHDKMFQNIKAMLDASSEEAD